MHYINAVADHPPQSCLFPGAQGWKGDKDVNVFGGIRNTTNLLGQWVKQGGDLSDPVASEALKFLIHFLGDMHMPFHLVGREQGANTVPVKWSGEEVSKCFSFCHGLFVGYTAGIENLWNRVAPNVGCRCRREGHEKHPRKME